LTINTILIDFDGVLRHWTGTEVQDLLSELNLKDHVLFACAFSDKHLLPAITGQITHEQWCDAVQSELSQVHGEDIAAKLVASWYTSSSEIDFEFLKNIRVLAPAASLVLVSNATSRLASDLSKAGLASAFDLVLNSSELGVAKPERAFFEAALNLTGSKAQACILIDDSLANVNSARAMGIESIHHTDTQASLDFIAQKCTSRA